VHGLAVGHARLAVAQQLAQVEVAHLKQETENGRAKFTVFGVAGKGAGWLLLPAVLTKVTCKVGHGVIVWRGKRKLPNSFLQIVHSCMGDPSCGPQAGRWKVRRKKA
jgi:hypothetical protein